MFDFEIPTQFVPGCDGNLDDRRPRTLAAVVGQGELVRRISQAAKSGGLRGRFAFVGATGAGKTTVSTVVARMFFCHQSRQLGDACGTCTTCAKASLTDLASYHEWTGAQLNDDWGWWAENGKHILDRNTHCFFLDEAQDLSPHHQKALFRQLETARALVIFATTHEHLLNDALLGRFGANKFTVRRPSLTETVDCMKRHCNALGVAAAEKDLSVVAQHYDMNLRLCVDFVYAARDQTPDGRITREFVTSVTGLPPRAIAR